jgi:glycosyltransferase involved in cell wall biosynthesis
VDCISFLFEQALHMGPSFGSRLKAWLDLGRTRRYEAWLVTQFDRVLVTSETDKQALEALHATRNTQHASRFTFHLSRNPQPALSHVKGSAIPNTRYPISVLPNGVDLDYFKPMGVPQDSAVLVLTGKMSYHANVAAARYLVHEIMPRVWTQRPDVKLYIVGKDPPREITNLKSKMPNIQYLVSNPSQPSSAIRHQPIAVTGTVPDVRPYLAQAAIAVCPVLYSAGIQNKVLEAMAMGIPVVATPQSCAALETVHGENILIAEEPKEFAQRVLELLDDEGLRERIGKNGRRYVEEHHDWRDVARRLEEIYQDVIERKEWTA